MMKSRHRSSKAVLRLPDLEHAKSVFRFDCLNQECVGGGFDLSDLLAQAVAKRSKVLSDYTFAVRDEASGALKIIGKAYSGLTDAEIAELTAHFLTKVIRSHGRYHEVEPDTVLEIAFDRVQPSARHNSGLALRFPRIVRIRTDKSPADVDTLAAARRLVN